MHLRRRLLACLLLLCCAPPLSARDRPFLPPEVERVLAERRIPATSLSVLVREVGRDEPLVSVNAAVPRNPASTMKVVTTYAALEMLGPAYTWQTRAYATGAVRDLVLDGNLVLEGGGDPFMTADRWWGFVNGLRQAGIERIARRRGDRQQLLRAPGRRPGRLRQPSVPHLQRAAGRAAGEFPDRQRERRCPTPPTGSARVRVNPWPANLSVDNSVRLERGPCRRGGGGVVVAMPEGPSGNRLSLGGHYASGCGPMSVTRAVMRAPDFAFGTFKTFWQQSGGIAGRRHAPRRRAARRAAALHARVADARRGDPPRQQVLEQRDGAAPAADACGREGRPAGHHGGRRAASSASSSPAAASTCPDLVLENGVGPVAGRAHLGRGTRRRAARCLAQPVRPEFQASLPLSAVDGTLRRRFRSPDMEGRLRMKTGTLQDVSALAGYVNAASGRTYVAVIILNHPGAELGAGESVQAALVDWVFGR